MAFAVLITITTAIAVYYQWKNYSAVDESINREDLAVDRLQELLSLVKDAETGQRGYLLTGDNRYLKHYSSARPQVESLLKELESTPGRPIEFTYLRPLIANKFSELERTITLRRAGNREEALEIVRSGLGNATMDEIRRVGRRAMFSQIQQSRAANAQARVLAERIRWLILAGSGIVTILLFGSTVQVRRLLRSQERLIEDLDRAKRDIENEKETFETTLRSIGDAVISTDDAGCVRFMNGVAENLTGWSREEAAGLPLASVFPITNETTGEAVDNPVDKVLREGVVIGLANHTLLRHRNGRQVPIDDSGAPIRDRDNRVTGVVLVFRDVSEQKLSQKQLADSEHRHRMMFESNPQPMWIFDPDTLRFLDVNETAIRHYGYAREEFLRLSLRDIRPQEDVPNLMDDIARHNTAFHTDGPWRHRKKDGSLIDVEVTCQTIDFQGQDARYVMINDITDRKRAQEALQHSEELLRVVIETAPLALWGLDTQGNITLWNRASSTLFGWEPEEVLNRPLPLIPADRREELVPWLAAHPVAPTPPGYETMLARRDGSQVPVSIWTTPLARNGARIGGSLAIAADLTQRKHAERTLAHAEAGFRLLFEDNPQPMWVFDAATLKFIEVNHAAIEHYGFTREEFLAMCVSDVRTEEETAKLLRQMRQQHETVYHSGISRHRRKDGTLIDVEFVFLRIEFRGVPAMISVLYDITDKRRLEDQLRQTQKLEAIGSLAGGVAHDFNNLLTVISGYAEMMKRGEISDGQPIDEILKASERASSLTRQLLAFSRRQVLQPQVLNLSASILKIHTMLGRLLGEDISVIVELEPNLWNVSADPGQVDQIVMNLAVNARDAMENGGTLTIRTENVHLDDTYASTHVGVQPGEYVAMSVSDTGCGMTEETKVRLFEPFFTTKEIGRGTGLGLSTVYGIVKQSGGNIWVYSELGRGTMFTIYLPRFAGETAQESSTPRPAPKATAEETILIVEDDPTVRTLIASMLSHSGYKTMIAENAADALRICGDRSIPIDLLISDLVMPDMDGREVGRRALQARPELAVLYMSGYTEHAVLRQNPFQSGTFFIQKPFSHVGLATKVREILDGNIPTHASNGSFS